MTFAELAQLHGGFVASRILQTAVALGIFDVLESGPHASSAVAAARRLEPRATALLLNALVGLRLLTKQGATYALTEAADTYLRTASSRSLTWWILFEGALWDVWERLPEAVRTGQPARPADMFQSDAGDTERFIRAMHSLVEARGDAPLVADLLDLTRVQRLLDIGSGPGTYPITFCQRHPHLHATIFDLPGTLRVTRTIVDAADCRDRIDLVAGDYGRDPLPGGFDLGFLSNIIHGEDETTNIALMAKVAGALRSGGRIVIKDHILDDSLTHPAVGALFSLQMLLCTRGRDYGFGEVRAWLASAGFTQIEERVLPAPLTSSLVIGLKP
jgi:SAM-dependent methyltransferase